jgi:DNA-binding NtrC family response regulator
MPLSRQPKAGYDVLVVDDDADIREALVLTLTDQGLTAAEAASGREALSRLRNDGRPSAMLLDLMMPDDAESFVLKRQIKGVADVFVILDEENVADWPLWRLAHECARAVWHLRILSTSLQCAGP